MVQQGSAKPKRRRGGPYLGIWAVVVLFYGCVLTPRLGGVYLSLSSWVTRLVKRPHSRPMRKSRATPAPITVRM